MDSPNVELMSALSSLYETGKYSDLTLVCGMKSYSVHRALVCSRSEFFEGACRNPFRESESGIIDLTEDDPEAVEHMVNYFYHLDYLKKPLSHKSSQQSPTRKSPMSAQRAHYGGSKKLDLTLLEDPLLAIMAANTVGAAPPSPPDEAQHIQFPSGTRSSSINNTTSTKLPDTPMEEPFDQNPFDGNADQPEESVEKANLLLHARVYALGEKYGIPGLKSLARNKFAAQIDLHLQSPEFPEACQEAYESTVDSDRGLRDVIIQAFRAHPDLPLRRDVELIVRDTPSLAFELFRMASGLPVHS
ncbi:hypothetical protein BU24DRAFT_423391 [Aaosphaeria arxii CBS 175.79]|uniref:BTB domain-containing protein n=1 Tax=Aaosphaeria arxii CBS 175.79 TaxID=1450172 RepID=A0A6A5XNH4_9PLEO|nr:uncharacterized protein BU24DRAFT_423391 [Aaosphaeria arxii CBS 175.79]KAF2014456.1 hypothetical protein BU24DRAFT_423391 [Aaosphaeria arxii CBS 175.79]